MDVSGLVTLSVRRVLEGVASAAQLHWQTKERTKDAPLVEFMYLVFTRMPGERMYLWWSLYSLYIYACQVRVTVGDSCGVYVPCIYMHAR